MQAEGDCKLYEDIEEPKKGTIKECKKQLSRVFDHRKYACQRKMSGKFWIQHDWPIHVHGNTGYFEQTERQTALKAISDCHTIQDVMIVVKFTC